jgi:hypothetical protein
VKQIFFESGNIDDFFLQYNAITLEDAIDIREINNIKLANQLLKLKRRKKQEQDQQNAMQAQQMQAQINAQSQQMAAQNAMQQIQAETQSKMMIKQAEIGYEIEKMKSEAQLKMELMNIEYQMNMQLKGVEAQAITMKDEMKEKAKDNRILKQATTQSKLIEQRKNNLPPVDFESTEDSLDGFDLAEFEPR